MILKYARNMPKISLLPSERSDNTDQTALEALKQVRTSRWDVVMAETATQEGLKAVARLFINGIITAADFIPAGIGDAPGWLADGLKLVAKMFPRLRNLDLNPDVPLWAAGGSEIPDVMVGGLAPSHLVELIWQGVADAKQGDFGAFYRALGYLCTGKEDYLKSLHEASERLNAAAAALESGKKE